jgi:hypothetical protein
MKPILAWWVERYETAVERLAQLDANRAAERAAAAERASERDNAVSQEPGKAAMARHVAAADERATEVKREQYREALERGKAERDDAAFSIADHIWRETEDQRIAAYLQASPSAMERSELLVGKAAPITWPVDDGSEIVLTTLRHAHGHVEHRIERKR